MKDLKKELYDLIDRLEIAALFSKIEEFETFEIIEIEHKPLLSKLKAQFISGDISFDFYDKLKTWISIGVNFTIKHNTNANVNILDDTNTQYLNKNNTNVDLSLAPNISNFYGREKEIDILNSWITIDNAKLIYILGLKGIGKTKIATKIANLLEKEGNFDFIVWRKLLNEQPLNELLIDLIKFLSNQKELLTSFDTNYLLERLLFYFQKNKCLLILDNYESILSEQNSNSEYKNSYENYRKLLNLIGDTPHNSCLLVTGRVKPLEVVKLEGKNKPTRVIEIKGVDIEVCRKILVNDNEIEATDNDLFQILKLYDGNPLALELCSKHINEVYFCDLNSFLNSGKPLFCDITDLLEWHNNRLSYAEKELLYWLAINRDPITLNEIKDDLLSIESKENLPNTLQLLQRHLPIEKNHKSITIQPVLIEYFTSKIIQHIGSEIKINDSSSSLLIDEFIKLIVNEISNSNIHLFNTHAIIKSSSKDYIRESQIRILLKPIQEKLIYFYGSIHNLALKFDEIIKNLQKTENKIQGYLVGNILNILCNSDYEIANKDLRNLFIKQAFFQNINLRNINFSGSTFNKTSFTDTFGTVQCIVLSNSKNFIALGSTNNDIRIMSAKDNSLLFKLIGHNDWVWSICFSKSDNLLISGGEDKTVKIWNLISGDCILTLNTDRQVRTVALSNDGNFIIAGLENGKIYLWDINGVCLNIFEEHTDMIKDLTFIPFINNLFVSCSDDNNIKIWNLETYGCVSTLTGHTEPVLCITTSKDGKKLYSGSADSLIKIWDLTDFICLTSLYGHNDWVYDICLDSDNHILISTSQDKSIKIWDLEKNSCISTLLGHLESVISICHNPIRNELITSSDDQTLKYWDLESFNCNQTIFGYNNAVWCVKINAASNILAISDNFEITLWDLSTHEFIGNLRGHTGRIRSFEFYNDSKLVISTSEDKMIKFWNLNNLKCIFEVIAHTEAICASDYNSIIDLFATSSEDNTIKLWSIKDKRCIHTFQNDSFAVRAISFSPFGNFLASGSDDNLVKIWNLHTKNIEKTLHGHENCVRAISYLDENTLVTSGEDNLIKIWDLDTCSCKITLNQHENMVKTLFIENEKLLIFSGSDDKTVKIWDVNGMLINSLNIKSGNIKSVIFYKSNMFCGIENGTVEIWDIAQNKKIKTIIPPRPYENMNITNVLGLTNAEKENLKNLGAFSNNDL